MIVTKGALTMLGLNTPQAEIFWNGKAVPGVTSIRVDWEQDEQRIRLKVSDINNPVCAEMSVAGISIKKG